MSATFPTISQSLLGRWPTLCPVFSMMHLADTVRQRQAGAELLAGVWLCGSFEWLSLSVSVCAHSIGLCLPPTRFLLRAAGLGHPQCRLSPLCRPASSSVA